MNQTKKKKSIDVEIDIINLSFPYIKVFLKLQAKQKKVVKRMQNRIE
jgi:hypothetical protein